MEMVPAVLRAVVAVPVPDLGAGFLITAGQSQLPPLLLPSMRHWEDLDEQDREDMQLGDYKVQVLVEAYLTDRVLSI